MRVQAALVTAAVLAWVPPAAVGIVRLNWRTVPPRVPVHWSGAGPDQWASVGLAFWGCIAPGIVGAVVCSLLVVPLSSDVSRRGAALTMGALSAGTGAIAFLWLAMALTAAGIGAPFLVVLAPVGWGVLVFGVALLAKAPPAR